jgi:ABC-type branched-subunit amino acid transport system ATPase component
MLKIENLSKIFDDIIALDKVSLEIYSCYFWGLLVPNGARKTTLMNHIIGFLKADSCKTMVLSSLMSLLIY